MSVIDWIAEDLDVPAYWIRAALLPAVMAVVAGIAGLALWLAQ